MSKATRTSAQQAGAIRRALRCARQMDGRAFHETAIRYFDEVLRQLDNHTSLRSSGSPYSTHGAEALSYVVKNMSDDRLGTMVKALSGGPMRLDFSEDRLEDPISLALERKAYHLIPVLHGAGIPYWQNPARLTRVGRHIGSGGWPYPELIAPDLIKMGGLTGLMKGALDSLCANVPVANIKNSLAKLFDMTPASLKDEVSKAVNLGIFEWLATLGQPFKLLNRPEPAAELFCLLLQREHLDAPALMAAVGSRTFASELNEILAEAERRSLDRNTAVVVRLPTRKPARL